MTKKSIIQYSLLLFLIILSIFFYKEFLSTEKSLTKKTEKIDKKIESSITKENKETTNTIENLKYVSEDLLGNIYIINAKSAEVQEDKVNQVQLVEVLAKIIQQNDHARVCASLARRARRDLHHERV